MSNLMYVIQLNISISLLYLIFYGLSPYLRNYEINRLILFCLPVLAAILPLLSYTPAAQATSFILPTVMELPITAFRSSTNAILNRQSWLFITYLIGFLVTLTVLFYKIFALLRFIRQHKASNHKQYRLIECESAFSSFSFFRTIYVNPKDRMPIKEIIRHEQEHARRGHSWDNLWYALIACVFWFNPFVHLLHKLVRANHEYEVDEALIDNGKSINYLTMILQENEILRELSLSNPLYSRTNLLKRIRTMKKVHESKAKWQYLMLIPAIALIGLANACSEQKPEAEPATTSETTDSQDKMIEPDQMKEITQQASYEGGNEAMMSFLIDNLKYPEEAKKDGLSGKVMVSFVVDASGKVKDVKVVRGIHPILDEEAKRVVALMSEWNPAEMDGKAVGVQLTLPIVFKLDA